MNTQNNQNQASITQPDQTGQASTSNQVSVPTPILEQPPLPPLAQNANTQPQVTTNPTDNTGGNFTPSFLSASSDEEDVQFNQQQIKQERDQVRAIFDEIKQTKFEQLIEKYTLNRLADILLIAKPVSQESVIGQYITARQLFVVDFIKQGAMATFPAKSKDKIIALIANSNQGEDLANLQNVLLQIDQNATLPQNFQIQDYQPQAKELLQVCDNIKKTMVEVSYNEYLGDIKKLLVLPDDKYQQLATIVTQLDQEVANIYTPEKYRQPAPQELANKILAVLNSFGRTPMFVQHLKDENIFGNIAEVFSKIAYTVEIADVINAKNLIQPISDEIIRSEVKSYMFENMTLR